MVEPGSRVLDVGCGDGSLLALLRDRKGVDGRGIEISREGVNACLAKGLPVIQGDADTDLADYPDDAFDYVILSQTIQATRQPKVVLEHLLRIGRRAIVSFPNFGHWRVRFDLGLRGRMPVTENMPYSWYDTPNIHFCTIRDFVELCREVGAQMEKAVALDAGGQPMRVTLPWWVWNLLGEQGGVPARSGGKPRQCHSRPLSGKPSDGMGSHSAAMRRIASVQTLAGDGTASSSRLVPDRLLRTAAHKTWIPGPSSGDDAGAVTPPPSASGCRSRTMLFRRSSSTWV